MTSLLKAITNFFTFEKTVYSHRNRTIEMIALEQNIDINSVIDDAKTILKNKGRVEAISYIEKRFHVTLNAAWRFVDNIDN